MKAFAIDATSTQKEACKSDIQVKFDALINQLRDRFPYLELLVAFSILFDRQILPSDEEQLTLYGQDKVKILSTTYAEGSDHIVDAEQFTSEWEGFKRLIKNNYASKTMRQIFKLLCTDQSLRDMFPQLAKLAAIGALIPVSTAECERAFSAMNRIKTELRNRLKTSTLDCLMRVSMY